MLELSPQLYGVLIVLVMVLLLLLFRWLAFGGLVTWRRNRLTNEFLNTLEATFRARTESSVFREYVRVTLWNNRDTMVAALKGRDSGHISEMKNSFDSFVSEFLSQLEQGGYYEEVSSRDIAIEDIRTAVEFCFGSVPDSPLEAFLERLAEIEQTTS